MARSPSEEPEGLVYRPELISVDDEAELLRVLESLRFDPIVMHGQPARRTARHFGLDYDYEARTPQPGEPPPDWMLPVRARAAELAGHEPEELVEILVQRYPPGDRKSTRLNSSHTVISYAVFCNADPKIGRASCRERV